MYKVGDCVFYPLHGAGRIENIEEKRILGEKHEYYIMRIPVKNTEVMLPVENAEKLRVRDLKTPDEIDRLIIYMKETVD